MMYINFSTPPLNNNFVKNRRKTFTEKLLDKSDWDSKKTYIENGSDRWGKLKDWLAALSHDKCWFCESKSNRAPMDVEHFRPKLGVTINRVDLEFSIPHPLAGEKHPGYWWLTYEWSNYRLSCQRCNRPETDDATNIVHGKHNDFCLVNETYRCIDPNDNLSLEEPMLLDPIIASDCQLLAHTTDGEVKPSTLVPTDINYLRAEYTIHILGLNSFKMPENKKSERAKLDALILLCHRIGFNNCPPETLVAINSFLSPEAEYSQFFRASIGRFRSSMPWIENLL